MGRHGMATAQVLIPTRRTLVIACCRAQYSRRSEVSPADRSAMLQGRRRTARRRSPRGRGCRPSFFAFAFASTNFGDLAWMEIYRPSFPVLGSSQHRYRSSRAEPPSGVRSRPAPYLAASRFLLRPPKARPKAALRKAVRRTMVQLLGLQGLRAGRRQAIPVAGSRA